MDATFQIKKLEISIFCPNFLYSAKRASGKLRKIFKVWALQIFLFPKIFLVRYTKSTKPELINSGSVLYLNNNKLIFNLLKI